MSESKHTPGPWSAHEKGTHPNPYVCGAEREYEHGPDKPVVAYIVGTDTQANARLIAAAPDMLAALVTESVYEQAQEAFATACQQADDYEPGDETDQRLDDLGTFALELQGRAREMRLAAIAKAEGTLAAPLHEGSGE